MSKINFIEHDDRPPTKILVCDCGSKHDLSYYASDFGCSCGRLYNAFGQQLESYFGNGDEPYWAEEELF